MICMGFAGTGWSPSLHGPALLFVPTVFPAGCKEGLSRTVVRELLPRATTHRHQTSPDYGRHARSRSKGGYVREEAPDEEYAAKNLQTTVRHLGFTEKYTVFRARSYAANTKEEPQPFSRTPPANVDEKRPNVPIRRTLYLTSIKGGRRAKIS